MGGWPWGAIEEAIRDVHAKFFLENGQKIMNSLEIQSRETQSHGIGRNAQDDYGEIY